MTISDIAAAILATIFATITYECAVVELLITVACWIWLKRRPHVSLDVVKGIEEAGGRLASRPVLAALSILILAIGLRLALLPLMPIPNPFVPDEFSHLLVGATLKMGRLANPVHPMWIHFETIHEFFRPTFSSMYMPGQGIVLVAGWFLGHPWYGVLASGGLFAVSIHWMLRGWFPAKWAYAGAILCVLHFCLSGYWVNSFWGGFVPATGGALLCGAYVRLTRKPTVTGGVLLACGIAMLANTRPFEGLFLTAFVLISLAVEIYRRERIRTAILVRGIVPLLLIGSMTAFGMATYFRAVTGSPLVLPYGINQQTYGWPMTLPWYSPPKIELRHIALKNYYDWEIKEHEKVTTAVGLLSNTGLKLVKLWTFLIGPALSVPLLFLPLVWRNRRFRFLALGGLITLIPVVIEQTGYPHYFAPATACLIALEVQCLRHLRLYRLYGKPAGLAAIRLVFLVSLCIVAVRAVAPVKAASVNFPPQQYWCCRTDRGKDRADVLDKLERIPGMHLVLVRFDRKIYKGAEWVYNNPDIDASRVVWANDMGSRGNAELRNYYSDRTAWLVEPDANPARLIRLP